MAELTITISGLAGSGKSTTARSIAHHLKSHGYQVQLKDDGQRVEVPTDQEAHSLVLPVSPASIIARIETVEQETCLNFHYTFSSNSKD